MRCVRSSRRVGVLLEYRRVLVQAKPSYMRTDDRRNQRTRSGAVPKRQILRLFGGILGITLERFGGVDEPAVGD